MSKRTQHVTIEDSTILLKIDAGAYPLEAVLTASYHFIDEFYVFIGRDGATASVELRAKKKMPKARLEAHAGEFFNHLLSESIRLSISAGSKKFREKMLEQAIASALSAPAAGTQQISAPASRASEILELDEELKRIIEKVKNVDYIDNPLGIGVPVTEKGAPAAPKKKPRKK